MKKWMWITIAGVVAAAIATTVFFLVYDKEEEVGGDVHILELTQEQKTINEDIDFAIVDETGKVWLKAKHIERVLVAFEKTKDRWLELRLTDDGLDIFEDALDESEMLSIRVDGEIIASPVVLEEFEQKSAVIYGKKYMEEIMPWFNLLT